MGSAVRAEVQVARRRSLPPEWLLSHSGGRFVFAVGALSISALLLRQPVSEAPRVVLSALHTSTGGLVVAAALGASGLLYLWFGDSARRRTSRIFIAALTVAAVTFIARLSVVSGSF